MSQRPALPVTALMRQRGFGSSRLVDHATSSGVIIDPYLSYHKKNPPSLFSWEGKLLVGLLCHQDDFGAVGSRLCTL